MEDLTVSVGEHGDSDSIEAVEGIINRYNCDVMGSDYRPLTVLLRDLAS